MSRNRYRDQDSPGRRHHYEDELDRERQTESWSGRGRRFETDEGAQHLGSSSREQDGLNIRRTARNADYGSDRASRHELYRRDSQDRYDRHRSPVDSYGSRSEERNARKRLSKERREPRSPDVTSRRKRSRDHGDNRRKSPALPGISASRGEGEQNQSPPKRPRRSVDEDRWGSESHRHAVGRNRDFLDENGERKDTLMSSRDDDDGFVWKKKDQMLRRKGIRLSREDEEARRIEATKELERAKARREERQRQRDEIELEQAKAARQREQELNAGWDEKEAAFHGQQHYLRQAIRLRQGRGTLPDIIARNVRLDLLELPADPRSPCDMLESMAAELTTATLDELWDAVQLELDYIPDFPKDDDTEVFNADTRLQWWTCMETYLRELRKSRGVSQSHSDPNARAAHSAVESEIENTIKSKDLHELKEMEREVSSSVEGSEAERSEEYADVEFWLGVLGRVRRRVASLQMQELCETLTVERKRMVAALPTEERDGDVAKTHEVDDAVDGGTDEDMVQREASKGMGRDEEQFADVVEAPKRRVKGSYAWNDKYRPRKPRFFNRVHTGYDWNKYNRTHYDHDNPPPKTVQGYKFNIFYPDLIDRTIAPSFKLSKTENPEVAILTFVAGPPYEDIAFKIVNRPWEHSHRRGFRCTFDRGILHLWFNFRRYRYRR